MRTLVLAALAAIVLLCPAVAFAQDAVGGTISTTTCADTGGGSQSQETGCIVLNIGAAQASVDLQVKQASTGQGLLVFEGTTDNVTWLPLVGYPQPSGVPVTNTQTPGSWVIDPSGSRRVRVRASALDSGSFLVVMASSLAPPTPTIVGISGRNPRGGATPVSVTQQGAVLVLPIAPPLNPFLPRCNAVRTTQCQP